VTRLFKYEQERVRKVKAAQKAQIKEEMKEATFSPQLVARQSRIRDKSSRRSHSKSTSIAPAYAENEFVEINYPANSKSSKRLTGAHHRKSSAYLGQNGPVFDRLFEQGENLKSLK